MPPVFLTREAFAAPHAFTTRHGGCSEGPFASLNLGLSTGDRADHVEDNRRRVLDAFGVDRSAVCGLHQVHGTRVVDAESSWFSVQADGAVTDDPERVLLVSGADCLPLLLHDPLKGAIGIAHAGWRGTVGGIAAAVVERLRERYGSEPEDLEVVMGPGIRGCCYQVGPEVGRAFLDAGFPPTVLRPDGGGRSLLDLPAANREALVRLGVAPQRVLDLGLCTHCRPDLFFSHRREGGRTGRHWALLRLPPRREAG